MHSAAEFPRSGISLEAQAWLDANPSAPREIVTLENAERIRAETLAGFGPAMAAARAEFPVHERDIIEGAVPCSEIVGGNRADIVVLYFFGGGYVVGSPGEDIVITAPIAAAISGRVVAPLYPLSPQHSFPAASDVGLAVYRSLLTEFAPDRIVVAGESAGGNLALVTMLRARDEGMDLPAGLALLSPWADLGFSGDSHIANRDPVLPLSDGALRAMADDYRAGRPTNDPLISPIYADFTDFPPTFISTGTRDLLQSDAVRVSAAMREDGVDVTLRVWEGMWHVFEFYRELPEARASMTEIADFIVSRLGHSSQ
ncbi:MAG: alpha/beta hydrolase fold domain-containing protein [Actinobacteria bacterium]|nr:alpha/beta hydrolase fold domain-containing protein [Actinomycetota bacterium]